jgi:hypothetical protein
MVRGLSPGAGLIQYIWLPKWSFIGPREFNRTRIDEETIRHLFSRFRKDSIKSFLSAEEILKELELIFCDSNKRVNFMKTFKRLKQIQSYREFFIFWSEFQRLVSDVELYDKKMLIEDLKNKMFCELQKIMFNESYHVIDIHAFARRCLYTDQVLRDIKEKSRFKSRQSYQSNESMSQRISIIVTASITNRTFKFVVPQSHIDKKPALKKEVILTMSSCNLKDDLSDERCWVKTLICYNRTGGSLYTVVIRLRVKLA